MAIEGEAERLCILCILRSLNISKLSKILKIIKEKKKNAGCDTDHSFLDSLHSKKRKELTTLALVRCGEAYISPPACL